MFSHADPLYLYTQFLQWEKVFNNCTLIIILSVTVISLRLSNADLRKGEHIHEGKNIFMEKISERIISPVGGICGMYGLEY